MASKVFFAPAEDGFGVVRHLALLEKLYDAAETDSQIASGNIAAVKVHVGEEGNVTYLSPRFAAFLVERLKMKGAVPFVTETSTLYKGRRENAIEHVMHAHRQGYSIENLGAPVIMCDGLLGNSEIDVPIEGELCSSVKIASDIALADNLLVISHVTGHMLTSLGAAIKNLGMGLASRKGKRLQHSNLKPRIAEDSCVLCGKCIKWCPAGAIAPSAGKAFIHSETCIGCGECVTVCRFGAVRFNFDADSAHTQKLMAEHALGVMKDRVGSVMFFNFMINMTAECDCFAAPQKKVRPDVGILASQDPVAIDRASLDLTQLPLSAGAVSSSPGYGVLNPLIQLEHGQKIGLGSMEYELITV